MIRSFREEDADYIINSHCEIYGKEYNFDSSFREFIGKSVADFINRSDTDSEHIWIVEINEEPKGSIGITKQNENVAQLRLFLVDPSLRGTGMGRQLVQTAIDFCKEKNYNAISLWTNSELKAARHLYQKFGFELMETRQQRLSDQELIEERWQLYL